MAELGEIKVIKGKRLKYGFNPSTFKFRYYNRENIKKLGIITTESKYQPYKEVVDRNRASALRKNIVDTIRLRASDNIYNQKLADAFQRKLNQMSDEKIKKFSEDYANLIGAYFRYEFEAKPGSTEMDARIVILGEALGIDVNDFDMTYMNKNKWDEQYDKNLNEKMREFQTKVDTFGKNDFKDSDIEE